jgi:hypothetical protein
MANLLLAEPLCTLCEYPERALVANLVITAGLTYFNSERILAKEIKELLGLITDLV